MSAISIGGLNNGKLDLDHIAEVATSTGRTATDRKGNVKLTVSAAIESLKAFNPRGAWTVATHYAVKDIFTSNGMAYAVVVAHTSVSVAGDLLVGNVVIHQGATREELAAVGGSKGVGFIQKGIGAVARDIESELRDRAICVTQFGAVADWDGAQGTDNTAAFQAALNATSIFGGSVFVPAGSYKISDTLIMDTGQYTFGLILFGEGRNSIIVQTGAGKDAVHFSNSQFLQNSGLSDLAITSTQAAGHCVNIVYGCTTCFISNVDLSVMNPAKSCVYGNYTTFGGGIFDTKFSGGSWYCDPASTQPGFRVVANGTIFNENIFENLRCYQAKTLQFFHITTVGQSAIWLVNNTWKNINFEICTGGGIYFSSAKNWKLENLSFWDAGGKYKNNLIDMVAGSGYESCANTFINVTRNGDELEQFVRDIRIVSGQDTVLINCYTPSDHGPSYDFSNKRVTVIGSMFGIENRNNTNIQMSDLISLPALVADNVSGGVIHIAGRITENFADISYGGGFVQVVPTQASSGVILSSQTAGLAERKLVWQSVALYPLADNTASMGLGANRWSVVHAGTGAINTSDADHKQQIRAIDAAVLRAWSKVEFCQYKFNDAVETKADGARWHVGVIAQRVKEAFESEGLDPFAYGVLCYDEWAAAPAVLDDQGAVVLPAITAGSRYGIRYEEALALECAYLRSRLSMIGVAG